MKRSFPFAASFVLATALLAGCTTINSRIQEHSAVYASLEAETQQKIQEGRVELGYTPEMVYMALGRPDRKQEQIAQGGRHEIWTYKSYYTDFLGRQRVGFRRHIVRDPVSGRPVAYLSPVYRDVYQEREEENIVISFRDGRVAMIEEAKQAS